MSGQRLDKWLFFARLIKSRSLASRLIQGGKVRVNRVKCDRASQTVQIGDVITASILGRVRVVKVQAAGSRRGPAAEAQALYEDLSPPVSAAADSQAGAPGLGAVSPGRPSKRDRRALLALRRSDAE